MIKWLNIDSIWFLYKTKFIIILQYYIIYIYITIYTRYYIILLWTFFAIDFDSTKWADESRREKFTKQFTYSPFKINRQHFIKKKKKYNKFIENIFFYGMLESKCSIKVSFKYFSTLARLYNYIILYII